METQENTVNYNGKTGNNCKLQWKTEKYSKLQWKHRKIL